jgi:hypothetical protein
MILNQTEMDSQTVNRHRAEISTVTSRPKRSSMGFGRFVGKPKRTQPLLPLGLGYVEGVTHDFRRHGLTNYILKGALLFELWTTQRHRPTRDADFARLASFLVPVVKSGQQERAQDNAWTPAHAWDPAPRP